MTNECVLQWRNCEGSCYGDWQGIISLVQGIAFSSTLEVSYSKAYLSLPVVCDHQYTISPFRVLVTEADDRNIEPLVSGYMEKYVQ